MSISRLRQNLLAVRTSLLEAGASGTADDTSQSVCFTRHGCKYENTGRVGNSECFPVKQVTLVGSVAHSNTDFLMQQALLGGCLYMHLSEFICVGRFAPVPQPILWRG